MSDKKNNNNNDKIIFWFKGVSYKVSRRAVLAKHCHAKLKTFIKGEIKMVAVRLKENGSCAWNAYGIELSASKMHGLPKAKPSTLTDKIKPLKKRPNPDAFSFVFSCFWFKIILRLRINRN